MSVSSWMNSGGLFGGYGTMYGALPQEDQRRANQLGLLAAGSTILQHAVEPGNYNYGGNLAKGLMAGRGLFEDQLSTYAQLRAQQAKIAQAEAEKKAKEEQALAEKAAKYQAQIDKEDAATAKELDAKQKQIEQANLVSVRKGITPDQALALPDSAREKAYAALIVPPDPKPVEQIIHGDYIYSKNPDGTLTPVRAVPKAAAASKTVDPAKAEAKFAARVLAEMKATIEVPSVMGITHKPKYASMDEAVAAVRAQDAALARILAPGAGSDLHDPSMVVAAPTVTGHGPRGLVIPDGLDLPSYNAALDQVKKDLRTSSLEEATKRLLAHGASASLVARLLDDAQSGPQRGGFADTQNNGR